MAEDIPKTANLSPAKRALLERMRKRVSLSAAPVIHRSRRSSAPLSFAQQRMWLIQQLDPDSYLYNEPRALHICGHVDAAAMEQALNSIVQRHEILRTAFEQDENGEPWQKIAPELRVELPCTDLRGVPPERRPSQLHRLMLEFGMQPFYLTRLPLFRARLFRLAEDESVLAMSFHHIISDGWTGGVMYREMGEFYEAHLRGSEPQVPELPVQYADYAIWQREWMQGPVLENELQFWRKHLEDAPSTLDLPTDRPRPENLSYAGDYASVSLRPEVYERLKSLCHAEATTLFPAMLAALDITLARWSGQYDLILGTISAVRDQTEIENLIGCFTNFLPLRATPLQDETALEFLQRTKQTVLDGFAHQNCPFEKITEAVQPERALNVNPLYNVSLQVQNYPEMVFRTTTLEARNFRFDLGVAFLDLRFVAEERSGVMEIDCEYNQQLFDRDSVDQLLRGYASVLEQITARPQVQIADIALPHRLLEQAAKSRQRAQKHTLAITSTFTAEPIKASLSFWMKELGINADLVFAPYNQVFQQLLDPSSRLSANQNGTNFVLVRFSDWCRSEKEDEARQEILQGAQELARALRSAAQRSPTSIIVGVCPSARLLTMRAGWEEFLGAAEAKLASELESLGNVHLITPGETQKRYPLDNYEDPYADDLGHIPYVPAFFTALGSTLARRVFALRSPARQVIVVECDHTLWDGSCELGPVQVTEAQHAFQEFLLAQANAGMLLCLFSPASDEALNRTFAQCPGMLLADEHIVSRRLSSDSVTRSLEEFAEELQIGLEHFVFISRSRETCAQAQAHSPAVLTLQLPDDAKKIPSFVSAIWAFDRWCGASPQPREAMASGASAGRLLMRIAAEWPDVEAISRALERTRDSARGVEASFVAPRTPTEELVAGAWAQLLNVSRVGIHDNFFSLGGHSLLAAQVLARVRQVLGVELPLRALFEAPTVAELAERIDAVRRSGASLPLSAIPKLADRSLVPLSFAQQRLWFLHQLEPENPAYNIPLMFRVRGRLSVEHLHASLNLIVERHESLRTTFALHNNEPVQVIHAKLELPLPVHDLSTVVGEQQASQIQKLAAEEANRAFSLSSGPLLRAGLLRLGAEEHILLVTMHHIVSDRWSLGVLSQELAANYAALSAGSTPELPPLRIQYADFAAWQRQYLQGELVEKQVGYWKKQLAGAPELLEFPTDHSRPPVMSGRGATQSVVLSRDLVSKLSKLSQSEGATLFMTLLAAFQTLLSRYSGQEDIVVGSPIANRSIAELEPLIGFFINTLALRGDLSGDPSFRELLARTKETCLQAYAHQDIPFEKLVEELQPGRSLSHSPIFQVMFAFQNAPMQALKLAGVELERMPLYTGTSMFDMSWFALEVSEGLMIRAEYSTDLFNDSTITRALEHFQQLLESAVANPAQRISQLSLLPERERRQILVEFNANAADYPVGRLQDFVERSASRVPDAVAIVCGGERTTYRELNERANQIAHHLRTLGAGPDVLVGVFLERTSNLLPAILGVLKSGSAYVPLDPSYPKERIAAIVEDAKAPIVLAQQSLMEPLAGTAAKIVCLDLDQEVIARQSTENPGIEVEPENLAYVLFTSGSTGRPKGVALEHRSAVTFVHWAQTVFSPEELRGVLLSTSVCFDLSIFEIFVPLSVGGTVIVVQNALYLPSAEARDQVTLINTVPSAIAELVRMSAVPPSVKTVNLAGEALPSALVNDIYSSTCASKVYNLYGPTEDTTYSTYTLTQPHTRVTIGKPLPNTQAYILDRNLNPVPIGVPGELYLAGAGLARGYFGRPDLTAERFLSHSLGSDKYPRMYKTGDLCRWLPSGEIEYLGRMDHQVKLRGFRIELGEIEAVLAKHPAVRQCLVLAREDNPGMKRLVAYLVPQGAMEPTDAELAAHLKKSLPEFMLPSAFVRLQAFPLTPNGKIDRKALPAPEYKKDAEAGYIGPRNPGEEKLAAIWAQVLHLDQVSADADFFALGGHSLLAAQVISRIRQAFAVDLPMKAMFESPTLEALAARVASIKPESDVHAIRSVSREKPLPASFAQQRLWFLDQLEPDSPAYNIAYTLKISGRVDVGAIERGLALIVARHESLRTTFTLEDDTPVQRIQRSAVLPFVKLDLTSLEPGAREAEARRRIAEDANRPFNLSQAPLARALFLSLGEEDHYLLLSIHHIIADRWSLGVITQEFISAYEAIVEGEPPQLPELTLQYADYSEWQRGWLDGEVLRTQLAYWKEKLKDAPPVLELPTDRPRPATESFHGDVAYMSFPREFADKLKQVSYAHGATLFMTLLAGFQALLSRYSGQDDIVVGTAVANRTHPDLEKVVGLFLNTLPLRTRLHDDPSFSEILARAKETALGAYAHQAMPFEKLVEALNPERSLSHSPLVQVYFVLQNAPTESLEMKGLALKPVPSGLKTVKGDMYLSMHETEHGLEACLEYSTDLFHAATMQHFLGHFQVLLDAAVSNPNCRLSELPILTAAEREMILVDWNATRSEYPRRACAQELFELQAGRTPDKVAATFGNETITYAELNARANQLARFLRATGVGPEKPVGVYLERGLNMLVALLGILKAGGAYIPLDPAYPAERIAFILEDSAASLLIAQQSLLASIAGVTAKVICIDSEWKEIARESSDNPQSTAAPENLAYILYTSGSTGKPKGVQIEHRSLVNFLVSVQKEPGLAPSDRLLAVTTLSFDIAGLELYLPLITGAEIILASRDEAAEGQRLLALMERSKPTFMQATPATWHMLMEAGWEGSPQLKVLCGGEALPPDLADKLRPRCRELWNMYGPTETTIWSSVYPVTTQLLGAAPIGHPIANTAMYVLDEQRRPVPVGVTGELYIGGDGLARGYYNRPELTAEKFVADPFNPDASARMYRTGDLARYLPDGNIQFLGRTDFQVKVRGFRIELGEIEAALARHPAVRQSVVAVREARPGDKRLVAYLVMQPGQHLRMGEIRTFLKKALPEYMVPSAAVELETLPLTPNGKVDRKQLPAPDYAAVESPVSSRRPSTPTQEMVAGIFSEVLKVPQPGIDGDFFELGGHSLLAAQVISRVRQAFKLEMPLRALFEAPTVGGLAERVEAALRQEHGLTAPPMRRVPRGQPLPVSFSQQRLWFLDQLEPGNPLYNVAYATRVRGPLRADLLERSINQIIRRHESLRTTFQTVNDQPRQIIAAPFDFQLQQCDTSHLPSLQERENEARKVASEEIQRPFDLTRGPLLRGLLIRIGDEDYGLILTTHHIISDRWSLSVLSQETAALYEAELQGKPSPLAELEFQYADFAVWQRDYLSGPVLDKQLSYWRRQLDGAAPVLELPTDRPRTATEHFWGARHLQAIPENLATSLKALSRAQRGTFFMSLLAGFQLVLGKLSGQNDVVVGTDLANRNQLEAERMIGFFVNLLPMRARISADAGFKDFFQQVRDSSLEAMAHQDIPFDKLVEELRPERSLTHNPLVQVLFVMQNTPPEASEFGGLKLGPLGVSSSSRFDLVLFVNNPETQPAAMWVYNPKLFDASTIARIADAYELVLKTISADPDVKIAALFATLQQLEEARRGQEQKRFQEAGLEKLRKVRRKTIEVS
ncbi:MAG TPA: amino acid adenylation domain-containing protein [Terriglobales bacterium]